jgi:hypothetical protein
MTYERLVAIPPASGASFGASDGDLRGVQGKVESIESVTY